MARSPRQCRDHQEASLLRPTPRQENGFARSPFLYQLLSQRFEKFRGSLRDSSTGWTSTSSRRHTEGALRADLSAGHCPWVLTVAGTERDAWGQQNRSATKIPAARPRSNCANTDRPGRAPGSRRRRIGPRHHARLAVEVGEDPNQDGFPVNHERTHPVAESRLREEPVVAVLRP
jgi:hypothetical protein